MGSESIQVSIFGKQYLVRCDGADTEMTMRVAQYVDSKMMDLREASRDEIKIAVLAALNIAGELFETKAKYEAELKAANAYQEKIKSLNDKIGRAADVPIPR